jgi:D-beta-D-heptose 7-phosphate kinase/D-beta-D-heptose 1-phosphate adenosyltransferase
MTKKKIVVAVSGGFDPIHIGHIRNLKEAKKLGDKLLVILNTDDFLIRKKGKPFMVFDERKEILEAIRWVDEVVASVDTDQTVCQSLRHYKPDIFAKGGDRTIGNIPEKATCNELGIKMVFGVGGAKIQSSSWLIKGSRA